MFRRLGEAGGRHASGLPGHARLDGKERDEALSDVTAGRRHRTELLDAWLFARTGQPLSQIEPFFVCVELPQAARQQVLRVPG